MDARHHDPHAAYVDLPRLVQMGCRRVGWYSSDGLDSGGVANVERIVPQLQRAEVGDIVPMSVRGQVESP
jgi:hypothetical protein